MECESSSAAVPAHLESGDGLSDAHTARASEALHPCTVTGECSFAAVKVALVAYPTKQLPAPCSEGNHVHEKEGAVRCSRLGIKKTPLVRIITPYT